MEKPTVYFTDFRCPVGTSQLDKLKKLCIAAGIKDIDMDGKFVAIKMHFGELGNLAFLRPNYAKVVADLCKEQGGMPFLTDCNTLYPGSRKNALEHLDCANLNGFNTITTGCQIIIGDGLRGTDEVEVPVVNGEYCKTAFIGHAIMDADIFISLTHFKGHEATGFGGALKNIGMGCGSRAGKMQQHASGKPAINEEVCRGCRRCAKECGSDAITYVNKKAVIDYDKCKGCGRCIGACSFDAVYNPNSSANELLDRRTSVVMTSFIKILKEVGTFDDDNGKIEKMNQSKLLIIDDLGAERGTDYSLERVYDIIDSRYRSNKPIILTTNLTMEQMKNCEDIRYNRIYDRIFEMCYPVKVSGLSWRKREAASRYAATKQILEG